MAKQVRKKSRSRSRPLVGLKLGFGGVIALALVFFVLRAFTPYLGAPLFGGFSLVREVERVQHSISLEREGPIAYLVSSELIEQVVFPQDFTGSYDELEAILNLARNSNGPLESVLSPSQLLAIEAYDLAQQSGFRWTEGVQDFLVLSLVLRAGVPLPQSDAFETLGYRLSFIPQEEEQAETFIPVLQIPQAQLLEIEVEDPVSNSRFPEVPINPEELKQISRLVNENINVVTNTNRLITSASDNARDHFTNLLKALYPGEVIVQQ